MKHMQIEILNGLTFNEIQKEMNNTLLHISAEDVVDIDIKSIEGASTIIGIIKYFAGKEDITTNRSAF